MSWSMRRVAGLGLTYIELAWKLHDNVIIDSNIRHLLFGLTKWLCVLEERFLRFLNVAYSSLLSLGPRRGFLFFRIYSGRQICYATLYQHQNQTAKQLRPPLLLCPPDPSRASTRASPFLDPASS